MNDVILERLDGSATVGILGEIQRVYRRVFPDYDLDDHTARTTAQAKDPGFTGIVGRLQGEVVGFAYGLPLRGPHWWSGLEPAPAEGFTEETGERTFAVIDLAVLPDQRGRRVGRRLMEALLSSRPEQRATLATSPHNRAGQEMYERWGWAKVGQVPGGEGETQPVFDLYVIDLR